MTREEEIYEAAESFCAKANPQLLVGDYSFIQGVEWADEHPKSPWISIKDDLPCNHQDLTHSNYTDRVLVLSRNGYSEVAFMCIIEDVWEWNTLMNVSYWMPIPELPKEKQEIKL